MVDFFSHFFCDSVRVVLFFVGWKDIKGFHYIAGIRTKVGAMRCTVYGAKEFQRGISQIPPFKKRATPRFRFDLRYGVDRGTIQGVGYLDYLGVSTPPGITDPLYLSTSLFRSWRWRPSPKSWRDDLVTLRKRIDSYATVSIAFFLQFVPSIIDLKLERL